MCKSYSRRLRPLCKTKEYLKAIESELKEIGPITHVRVNIIPDGGLSRVRLYGQIEK